MESLGSSFFWVALGQIITINIVLSGDNAVVIALASRGLPPGQQKRAILFGSVGAIVLRVVLTFFAVLLLELPWLKIVGAALLVWIGIQMLVPESGDDEIDGHDHLVSAIRTIIVADFIMSLDNVLGVAAAAKGNLLLLVIGLGISIPLIIYGSAVILKLMNRFPVIVTLGGGVLGWVAGEMLVTDPAVRGWIDGNAHWLHEAAPLAGAFLVVTAGKLVAASRQERPYVIDVGGVPPAEEPPPEGYRWVRSRWRLMPDGTRDYAVSHGLAEFRHLAPVSSRLRPSRRVRPQRS